MSLFVPSKPDHNKAWSDRLTSAYPAYCSFIYEVKVPHQNALGLNLKPYSISYSSGSNGKSVGCLIVIDANMPLNSIIYPGDILLKVNDEPLITTATREFSFEAATKLITSAVAPRIIRFLRPGGSCTNTYPSPAELYLYLNEVNVAGRYTAVPTEPEPNPIPATPVVSISEQSQYIPQQGQVSNLVPAQEQVDSNKRMSYTYALSMPDSNQIAPTITRMLRNNKIVWDSSAVGVLSGNDVVTEKQEMNLMKGIPSLGAGIYKGPKAQYIAVLHIPKVDFLSPADESSLSSSSIGTSSANADVAVSSNANRKSSIYDLVDTYYIGKYDSEEEATNAYKLSIIEYNNTGIIMNNANVTSL